MRKIYRQRQGLRRLESRLILSISITFFMLGNGVLDAGRGGLFSV